MKNAMFVKAGLWSAMCLIANNVLAAEGEGTHRFPMRIIDRPAVMPTGTYNVDITGNLTGLKTIGVDAASQFGVVNKVEGHLSLDGFKINGQYKGKDTPFFLERVVKIGAKYNYHSMRHVSFAASTSLPIHVMDGEIIQDVTFGLPITFFNHMAAGQILGDVFNLRMRPNIEMGFNFPYWFGVQAYGNLWVQMKSSLAELKLDNKNNQAKWDSKGFWQKLPLTISATYAITNHFDLGGHFGFEDAFKAKETFLLGVTFSAHGGKIFG